MSLTTLFNQQFDQDESSIYLNHAAVGPWPVCAEQAVSAFAHENVKSGARYYPQWLAKEAALRSLLQQLIAAPSVDDIALAKNTSEALSMIAYGLDWQVGDNVVLSSWEFPSNRIVWESLQAYGVDVRVVVFDSVANPEDQLLAACDSATRLLTSSSVHYANGFRMDLAKLGEFCRQQSILFCVDAIQSLGALPFNVKDIGADFVVADGHKWMLGPEGLALFYCAESVRERLILRQFGWHMVAHMGDYDRTDWQPAQSARRFECGSPNMLGIHGLHASLTLLLEQISISSVYDAISRNTSYIIDFIESNNNYELMTCTDQQRQSGIVCFRPLRQDSQSLQQFLLSRGVVCAVRNGGIRFSPHCYQSTAQLDQALACLI